LRGNSQRPRTVRLQSMSTFARDGQPHGLTRDDVMKASEVAALFAVPVSTVLHWGRTGVLRRIKLGRHVRFFRADAERLVRARSDEPIA
jgi:excisionase family DNA binding protein